MRDDENVAFREVGRSDVSEKGGEVAAGPDVGEGRERAGEEGHGAEG